MLECDSYIQKPEADPLFLLWCFCCAADTPIYTVFTAELESPLLLIGCDSILLVQKKLQ